jgi:hypothetical protein
MKTIYDKTWGLVPKLGSLALLIAVILGTASFFQREQGVDDHQTRRYHTEYREYESSPQGEMQRDEGRERPRRGRHHHGPPPPPPGIPPTVLFLIGGALGFLIGRHRHPFPPPPPRPHCHHDRAPDPRKDA